MRPNQNTTDLLVSARPAGFMSSYPINLDQDKARCWKTLKTVPGSVGTATSGLCNGKCFVSAYKEGLPAVHNFDAYFYLELHPSALELSAKSLCDDSWPISM